MQARELLLLSRQDGELSGLGEGKHAKSETVSLITAPTQHYTVLGRYQSCYSKSRKLSFSELNS